MPKQPQQRSTSSQCVVLTMEVARAESVPRLNPSSQTPAAGQLQFNSHYLRLATNHFAAGKRLRMRSSDFFSVARPEFIHCSPKNFMKRRVTMANHTSVAAVNIPRL